LPATAETPVGGLDALRAADGVTTFDGTEGGLEPTALLATTVNV
jgi:hypothetical protein